MKTMSSKSVKVIIIAAFTMIFSLMAKAQSNQMYIKAMYDSITYDMGILKYFNGSLASADAFDINKMYGDVNVSLFDKTDSTMLTASLRPPFRNGSDLVPMNVTSIKNGTHQLIFTGTIFSNYSIILIDNYAGSTQTLNNGSIYKFSITNTIPSTSGKARFKLLVAPSASSLPVEFVNYSAIQDNKDVKVKWSTASEINNDHFEVEYSNDAVTFEKAGEVKGAGNSVNVNNYEFTHFGIYNYNTIYYRIKQVDFDGSAKYSSIMMINGKVENQIKENIANVYPTPAVDVVNIDYFNKNNNMTVTIFDMSGKSVKVAQNSPSTVDVNNLPGGNYIIHIADNNGNAMQTEKIIVIK